MKALFVVLSLLALTCSPAMAQRIKDVASIQGVRSNQLVGYGLVVGLAGNRRAKSVHRAKLSHHADQLWDQSGP